jgi:hypothetical protein
MCQTEEEPMVPFVETSSDENSNGAVTVFDSQEPERLIMEDDFVSRDEVFELKLSRESQCEDIEFSYFGEDAVPKQLKASHAELMDQLRSSLSSRRAEMKERESQAYLKLYGTLPEEQDEQLPVRSNPLKTQLLANDIETDADLHVQQIDESNRNAAAEDETFGDEIEEESEDEEVKSEFLATLQNLLRKRGCGVSFETYD